MAWSEEVTEVLQSLKPIKKNQQVISRIISLLDLTSLNSTDTESSIASFCEKAQTDYGPVAAVCVYPQFVRLVATQFDKSSIRTVSVANFPKGTSDIETVLIEINRILEDGGKEVDVVFPYAKYMEGDQSYAMSFVESCKVACRDATLKIILEISALESLSMIANAATDIFNAGADFVKTSTGKIPGGATLEAAAAILLVIRQLTPKLKRRIGIKVSGGIKKTQQAGEYIELADTIMGYEWVTPHTFRIGASQLLDDLLATT